MGPNASLESADSWQSRTLSPSEEEPSLPSAMMEVDEVDDNATLVPDTATATTVLASVAPVKRESRTRTTRAKSLASTAVEAAAEPPKRKRKSMDTATHEPARIERKRKQSTKASDTAGVSTSTAMLMNARSSTPTPTLDGPRVQSPFGEPSFMSLQEHNNALDDRITSMDSQLREVTAGFKKLEHQNLKLTQLLHDSMKRNEDLHQQNRELTGKCSDMLKECTTQAMENKTFASQIESSLADNISQLEDRLFDYFNESLPPNLRRGPESDPYDDASAVDSRTGWDNSTAEPVYTNAPPASTPPTTNYRPTRRGRGGGGGESGYRHQDRYQDQSSSYHNQGGYSNNNDQQGGNPRYNISGYRGRGRGRGRGGYHNNNSNSRHQPYPQRQSNSGLQRQPSPVTYYVPDYGEAPGPASVSVAGAPLRAPPVSSNNGPPQYNPGPYPSNRRNGDGRKRGNPSGNNSRYDFP